MRLTCSASSGWSATTSWTPPVLVGVKWWVVSSQIEGHHGPAAFGDRRLPAGPPLATVLLRAADQEGCAQCRADTRRGDADCQQRPLANVHRVPP